MYLLNPGDRAYGADNLYKSLPITSPTSHLHSLNLILFICRMYLYAFDRDPGLRAGSVDLAEDLLYCSCLHFYIQSVSMDRAPRQNEALQIAQAPEHQQGQNGPCY